jgi:molybdopterin molybdotransferase
MQPPRLKNDCFALPPGVNWTPVDEAQARLRDCLTPIARTETLATTLAEGRYLARDAVAVRSNPPSANSAVDGYGFAADFSADFAGADGGGIASDAVQILPLVEGRAAAGAAFPGAVPEGFAIRILTGAHLPEGVQTVILEEDVTVEDGKIAFYGPVKAGANTRRAGEDVIAGAVVVKAGARLRAQELAILAATGVAQVEVYRPLRIGVLSTGDEVRALGEAVAGDQIYDANGPMLLSLVARWGYAAVDLGRVGDDREALRARLDGARGRVDVILTSGGASAGDEDHVSALLKETGSLQAWRIALKPGRPLALGVWDGVPVFGLPGNPVAALVCMLIFAEPAFRLLGGGQWRAPQGFSVPAAFSKNKKPGRREYLRARLTQDGSAEVFASEGSGRISGLAWAQGLVEIEDGARQIQPGDSVRYIPFSSFGFD